jgi:hypothetical protein
MSDNNNGNKGGAKPQNNPESGGRIEKLKSQVPSMKTPPPPPPKNDKK